MVIMQLEALAQNARHRMQADAVEMELQSLNVAVLQAPTLWLHTLQNIISFLIRMESTYVNWILIIAKCKSLETPQHWDCVNLVIQTWATCLQAAVFVNFVLKFNKVALVQIV